MKGRLFRLDRAALGVSGVGGTALSLMAWPRVEEEEARQLWTPRLIAASRIIEEFPGGEVPEDHPLAGEVETVLAAFAYDARLNRAIGNSLDLGHLVMPWLKKANHEESALLPGMTKLTKAELMRAIAEVRLSHVDPANFNRSQWNPWLPAVHLAAAMLTVLQAAERAGVETDYWAVVRHWDWLEWWLQLAKEIEPAAIKAFPQIADSIVRVRIIELCAKVN